VTAFLDDLKARIALDGPIPVERYMALCLAQYYSSRDPFGAAGDFTTSPEISQAFGELIGLWAAEVWRGLGAPPSLRLIELGPGRGTLMADALRAARILPPFLGALDVHLVETSPALRERQQARLRGSPRPIAWHDRLEDVPSGPAIVIANEFFDALPVRQCVLTPEGWRERCVGLGSEGLVFGLAPTVQPEPALQALPGGRLAGASLRPGAVLEWPVAAIAFAKTLARRLVEGGGAALIIDYGYEGPAFGDTLQAVRGHAPVDPLATPGEADLTVHVDFRRLASAASAEGAGVHGPLSQGAFLRALGIEARTRALQAQATPEQARSLETALVRLTGSGRDAMGELFKVLAISHPGLAALPGLPASAAP
jgi:NADH dehydrogenase [ubiquinone] 1 alpha subcomplex assembly factor 7